MFTFLPSCSYFMKNSLSNTKSQASKVYERHSLSAGREMEGYIIWKRILDTFDHNVPGRHGYTPVLPRHRL